MLQSCRLGSTDLEVSELGIGTARLVHAGARSTRAAMAALNHALDSGVTYVDTADSYGFGMSERIVGAALHSRRDRVVLATKLGYVKKITAKALRRPTYQDFSPAHIERSLDASLRRLRTDYIDLYQLHSPPKHVIADGQWEEVFEKLRSAGKIRYYGVSVARAADVETVLAHSSPDVVQLPFSLLEVSDVALSRLQERSIGAVLRQPFAPGRLATAAVTRDEVAAALEPTYARPASREAEVVARAAARHGLDLAGLALRFARSAVGAAVTLVGMSSVRHLDENLSEFAAEPLPPLEFRQIADDLRSPAGL
jgi:aryl-alcohol dehydrogenase-like predicted oxidoreductase